MEKYLVDDVTRINLGCQGENNARKIVFDVTPWQQLYGLGELQLLHCRNGEDIPYPAAVHREDNQLIWPVSSVDTSRRGQGKAQLLYFVGDTLAKSICFETIVMPSLLEPGPVPEPQQQFLDHVTQQAALAQAAIGQVTTNAQAAEASAKRAERAAGQTGQDKQTILQASQQVHEDAAKTHQVVGSLEQTAASLTRQAQNAIRDTSDSCVQQVEQVGTEFKATIASDKQTAQNAAENARQYAGDSQGYSSQAWDAQQRIESALPLVSAAADNAQKFSGQAQQHQQDAQQAAQDAAEQANRAKAEADRSVSLGLSGVSAGDTIRIKAVDPAGIPTLWESVSPKRFELIEKKIIQQKSVFERTAEPDGTPYDFTALGLRITSENAAQKGFDASFAIQFSDGKILLCLEGSFSEENNYIFSKIFTEYGYWDMVRSYPVPGFYSAVETYRSNKSQFRFPAGSHITKLYSGSELPVGTEVEIWAVRA